jgi:hypothetical protein
LAGTKVRDVYSGILNQGKQDYKIDLAGIPCGMYLIRVVTADGVYNKKLIVE